MLRFVEVFGYKGEEQGDGTVTIPNVPIFETGKHRDVEYDNKWLDEAVENYEKDAKKDYYPPVVIGHDMWEGEKPAIGFLQGLRREGKRLVADLMGIHQEVMEQIQKGFWPSRSVELHSGERRVMALALLGRSEPYFRFPQMKNIEFKAEDVTDSIVWPHSLETTFVIQEQEKQSDKDNLEDEDMDEKKFTQEEVDEKIKGTREECEKESQAQIEKEFGMTPEQMKTKLDAVETEKVELAAEQRIKDIDTKAKERKAFSFKGDDGVTRVIQPGLIDMYSEIRKQIPDSGDDEAVIQFEASEDKHYPGPALDAFMDAFQNAAESGMLIIEIGDKVAGDSDPENPEFAGEKTKDQLVANKAKQIMAAAEKDGKKTTLAAAMEQAATEITDAEEAAETQ